MPPTSSTISENYGSLAAVDENGRDWDVRYWQAAGPAAIFRAAEGMIRDHRLLTRPDDPEPRIQRTVERYGRA